MRFIGSLGSWLCCLACLALIGGCNGRSNVKPVGTTGTPPSPTTTSGSLRFSSVAKQAGVDFALGHNGRTPLTVLETSGGGCAFLDFDTDGWPDILLVGPHNVGLFRNTRNGTFTDVTATSGLDKRGYWMGCAVGDYDGDGLPDLFLTGYGRHALYHNAGGGHFTDVTAQSGVGGLPWSMSATFADLNGDGKLDLFVTQYLKFDKGTPQICAVGKVRSACGPEVYEPLSGKLFLNQGGGRFKPAPWKDTGKTWGVVASDLQGTGRPALYLANDMMPGDFWVNEGGRWKNMGHASGTATDAQGHLQGGMGVDTGDYDNDGRLDLIVTTYFAQSTSLYHNDGQGLFTVTSGPSGIGPPGMPYVKFGTGFHDLDNDGWLDVLMANGHVRDNVHDFDTSQSYAQPLQVFHNNRGRFADWSQPAGIANIRAVGRGVSFGDYDRDGRVDVLVCDLEGPAVLLHNDSPQRHWLRVRLKAPAPNREGIGALVSLTAGGQTQIREIRTCGSVLSAREPLAHFGLGDFQGSAAVKVRWPDGKTQTSTIDQLDTNVTITRQ
jgi:enediyne biosynthesis protein E4